MDITWHGNTCFSIKDKSVSVLINPNIEGKKLKGDIVMSSGGEEIKIDPAEKLFNWPGEYEIKGVPIVALQSGSGEKNIIFCFEVADVKFCHLGELENVPSSEIFKEIGDVDVLMIKVGSGAKLDNKLSMEVIEGIEPKALIPMGDGVDEAALKLMGAEKVEAIDKFELKGPSDLPSDQTKFVILNKV